MKGGIMLKFYIQTREAVRSLHADQRGVVSFEYVLVAACIVGAVTLAFGTSTGGAIKDALDTSIAAIIAKLPS